MRLREVVGVFASAVVGWLAPGTSPRSNRVARPRAARRWALLALLGLFATTLAVATTYTYDSNGRLVAATNTAGQTAQYSYDVDGNLIKIARPAVAAMRVYGFSPGIGAVGAVVTVQGSGFSTTPGSNTIKFNGVASTVMAATATQLTTSVPAGATTGPVSVTVGTTTSTTAASFIVDGTTLPPTITTFSPHIGSAGTAVTVNGTSLNLLPGQTTVQLGQTTAFPTTINNTSIVFPIPATAGSGKISVSTFYGTATTTEDLVVAPPGIAAGAISQSTRISVDQAAKTFSVATAGQYVAELFDAKAGSFLTVQFSNMATNVAYSVYDRNNKLILSGTATPSAPSAHLPQLHSTGTYLLLMQPAAAGVTWSDMVEADTAVVPGAAPVAVATGGANQAKRLYFTETAAGANLGLGLSSFVTPGSGYQSLVQVFDPSGIPVGTWICYATNSGCDLHLPKLLAGTYTVIVPSPSGSSGMGFNATLTDDFMATLSAGTAYSLNLPRNGEVAVLSFSASAGATFALQVANETTVPAGQFVYYTIYAPSGSFVASSNTASALTLNLRNLPETGTYQVVVASQYGATNTAQVTLVPGVTGTLAVNGAVQTFGSAVPDQNIYLTFVNNTAGANLGLGFSNMSLAGGGFAAQVVVTNAAGTVIANPAAGCQWLGCNVYLSNLPVGTYSILVTPPNNGGHTVSFDATLSTNLTAALTKDQAYSLNVARHGQFASLSFNVATAGQTLALSVANQATVPATNGSATYTVIAPDGTVVGTSLGVSSSAMATLNLPSLTQTGTYHVFVNPTNGATLTAQVTLDSGATGTLAVGAAIKSFSTTVPGQNIYLTFANNTAGANLGLGFSNMALNGDYDVFINVYNAAGTLIASPYCLANGCNIAFNNLPAGTYSIVVVPNGSYATGFSATLSANKTGTLTPGTPFNVSVTRAGQNEDLAFTATAGQTATLQITAQATTPASQSISYYAYAVNGTTLTSLGSVGVSGATGTLTLPNLPAATSYLVRVNADYSATYTTKVTLGLQ